MKIAFFAEGYDPFVNGVVTALKAFRQEMARRGHEVTLYAPAYPGFADCDSQVIRLPSVKWSSVHYPCLSPIARSRDVLAGQEFDLVHSHHPFSMSRLAARLARKHGLPLVYSFHTLLTEYCRAVPVAPGLARRWLQWTMLRHCAEADRVTAPTAIIRELLYDEGVRTPIDVVPAPVTTRRPPPQSRDRVRGQYGVPAGIPLLLYAGRLAKEKQLDFLLRALAHLRAGTDFRLLLAGSGPVEKDLRRLAGRLGITGHVRFCGWVPHERMVEIYAAADLFVFPSTTDTQGIVLVEAMSAGLPCVAVARYGPSEVLLDGVTGLLVPVHEQQFAEAVHHLLQDAPLRRRMAEAAQRRALDFHPTVVGDRLCAVYERALHPRREASARQRPWVA